MVEGIQNPQALSLKCTVRANLYHWALPLIGHDTPFLSTLFIPHNHHTVVLERNCASREIDVLSLQLA